MAGYSLKDGVASLAYVPAIPVMLDKKEGVDAGTRPGMTWISSRKTSWLKRLDYAARLMSYAAAALPFGCTSAV